MPDLPSLSAEQRVLLQDILTAGAQLPNPIKNPTAPKHGCFLPGGNVSPEGYRDDSEDERDLTGVHSRENRRHCRCGAGAVVGRRWCMG